ncbi:MAG: DUF2723 domain-containing protein [Elusimicrobiota bacterium]
MIPFFISFFVSFAVYLFTICPTVAPYRDAGEMISNIAVLGIAHPPAYPFYLLAGKVFTFLIPWGNIAYQVNLFSAFFSALTVGLMTILMGLIFSESSLNRFWKNLLFISTALLLAGYSTFWYLSLVSEMYTLNAFLAVLSIIFIYRYKTANNPKYLYLLFLFFGLSLGNHLTILLLLPAIVYYIYRKENNLQLYFLSAIFFGMGLSIYFYLPLRSLQQPLIDWCDPQTWDRFWYVITRKGYGSGLDLISERYTLSQVLWPEFKIYLKNLFWAFTPAGFFLGLAGLVYSFKKLSLKESVFLLLLFIFPGPFFIVRAKMPPNPHALAIMEPHYILPNLIFFIWVIYGLKAGGQRYSKLFILLLLPFPVINYWRNYSEINKRQNYAARDWAKNVFSSLPNRSVVVARKDIQIFSLWELQLAEKKRPDLIILAQGLSGSPWYQSQLTLRYPSLILDKDLRTPEKFAYFIKNNLERRPIFYTLDAEATEGLEKEFLVFPRGLVNQLTFKEPRPDSKTILDRLSKTGNLLDLVYRGHYSLNSRDYPDFFTANLLEQYPEAHHLLGMSYFNHDQPKPAQKTFLQTIALNPEFTGSYTYLGYLYFKQELWDKAERAYLQTIKNLNLDYQKSLDYLSFPETVTSIQKEIANIHNNLGAVYERLEKPEQALKEYQSSLRYDPKHIDAWFNLAVLWWHKSDWDQVINTLQQLLAIAPQHQQARYYLDLAVKNKDKMGRIGKLGSGLES